MDYNYYNDLSNKQKVLLKGLKPINWLFNKMNLPIEIAPVGDSNQMISFEQRLNIFHLLNDVLVHDVEGEVVELGCNVGNSATQIQSILVNNNSSRQFHVYDKFGTWGGTNDVLKIFKANFGKQQLVLPHIHEGLFEETIPKELPDKLSFVHIDAGFGGDHKEYTKLMLFLLENVYPRMSKNAICVLMDYHDIFKTVRGKNVNPGVKSACDKFFVNKPEKVFILYGNHYSHGYFRKR